MNFEQIQKLTIQALEHSKGKEIKIPKGFFKNETYRKIYKEIQNGFTLFEIEEKLKKDIPGIHDTIHILIADWIPSFGYDIQKNINRAWAGELEQEAKKLMDDEVRGNDHTEKIKDLFQEAERLKAGAEEDEESVKDCSLAALADQYIKWREDRLNRKYLGYEIPDFPELTERLSGIREIMVIAGLPGKGKSTLALQIANNVYQNGVNVIYVDLENGRMGIMDRKAYQDSKVKPGENQEYDESMIAEAIQKFKDCKGFVIPKFDKLSLEIIHGLISELRETTKQTKTLLVIDSLQKLPFPDLKDRRDHVDAWLRNFEALNRDDPDLAIILISELSRGGLPKESGDIEYTAHFYLKLLEPKDDEDSRKLPVFIAKSRDTESQFGINYYRQDNWTFREEQGAFFDKNYLDGRE
ncbi:MAG: DnaB-like helicase C-terminal domain-containing protein [Candidatus Moraniibacteriota bacterium]